jgi:hypothetical protein
MSPPVTRPMPRSRFKVTLQPRPQAAVNLMQRTPRAIALQEAGLVTCDTIASDQRCCHY